MAQVTNETPSRFCNGILEIGLPYAYFSNTKTIILLVTFIYGITFVIMIIAKKETHKQTKKRNFVVFVYLFILFLIFFSNFNFFLQNYSIDIVLIHADPIFFP